MKEKLIGLLCLLDERIDFYEYFDDRRIPKRDRPFYRLASRALLVTVVFVWLCLVVLAYGLGS